MPTTLLRSPCRCCWTPPNGPRSRTDRSGPLTFEQVAAEIGVAIGRELEYRALPVDDYVTELVGAGFPEEDAAGLAYVFDEVLDGRNARVETGVRSVLGLSPGPSRSSSTARHSARLRSSG